MSMCVVHWTASWTHWPWYCVCRFLSLSLFNWLDHLLCSFVKGDCDHLSSWPKYRGGVTYARITVRQTAIQQRVCVQVKGCPLLMDV